MAAIVRSLRSIKSSPKSLLTTTVRSLSTTTSHSTLSTVTRPTENPVANFITPSFYAFSRLNQVRCARTGGSSYSPLNSSSSGSNYGDRTPIDMKPLFPGCDYNHWLIVMDKPGGEGATKQQMIDCYVETLAKVVGSPEDAKRIIYNVSCERYFGFGCELDEETSNKLEGLPGVLFVLPDSYVDAEHKDYGAELFVNGEIVARPPERQRKINETISASRNNHTNKDRPRYVRRRDNR